MYWCAKKSRTGLTFWRTLYNSWYQKTYGGARWQRYTAKSVRIGPATDPDLLNSNDTKEDVSGICCRFIYGILSPGGTVDSIAPASNLWTSNSSWRYLFIFLAILFGGQPATLTNSLVKWRSASVELVMAWIHSRTRPAVIITVDLPYI